MKALLEVITGAVGIVLPRRHVAKGNSGAEHVLLAVQQKINTEILVIIAGADAEKLITSQ